MRTADIAGFLFSAALASSLLPLIIRLAHSISAFDRPGTDKVHVQPVPTLGGLGVVAAVLGTLWGLEAMGAGLGPNHSLALSLAAFPILAVGVFDDLGFSSIPGKLTGHFLAGGILYAFGVRVIELTNPLGNSLPLGPLSLPITLLWVVGVVNAMNLVDGLDGLAAGVGGIAALSLALVGMLQGEGDVRGLGFVLAGAIAGFYPYNFPRARVFLGDVGSTFIGLVLATLALLHNRKATTAMTLLLPMVALGLPVLDTVFAVVRRTANGRNPLHRDLGHLHHRLLRLGLSPGQAVSLLLGVTTVFGAVAILLTRLPKQAVLSATITLSLVALGGLFGLLHLERRTQKTEPRGAGLPQKA